MIDENRLATFNRLLASFRIGESANTLKYILVSAKLQLTSQHNVLGHVKNISRSQCHEHFLIVIFITCAM